MNLHRLLHTTAIRLALRYALFYALLITMGLGVLYWTISHYVDVHMAASLESELARLIEIDREAGREQFIAMINEEQSLVNAESQRYYLLQSASGEKLAGNLLDWPHNFNADNTVRNVWIEDDLIPRRRDDDDDFWPVVATKLPDGARLLVAQSVHQAEDLQEFILGTMAVILAVSIGLALTMGWLLGRTLLQRIDLINATAQAVTAGELSGRIALSGQSDEFDELAGHLNAMLERIEKLLTGMHQVTDNIAHDLRRPLARMRNRIEVTLLEARDTKEYQLALEETLQDSDELIRTFNALLEIAQAEAGSVRGEWDLVDLTTLLQDLGDLYMDQAEAQGKHLALDIEPNLTLTGNRHLLAQAVGNLLDNAFKYTPDSALIQLEAKTKAGQLWLSVSDNGPGIALEQRGKVLERFVRLESERSTAGNGLGLSLVRAAAELHKAELRLEDNNPGLRVCLILNI
jgi:signal transduction histidine kinase